MSLERKLAKIEKTLLAKQEEAIEQNRKLMLEKMDEIKGMIKGCVKEVVAEEMKRQ